MKDLFFVFLITVTVLIAAPTPGVEDEILKEEIAEAAEESKALADELAELAEMHARLVGNRDRSGRK